MSPDITGLSDSTSVSELAALLGYSFDINEEVKITPRLGYSSWKVDSSEGFMFNPGPEITTSKKGSDLTYMLSASYRILYLTLQTVDYEFGSLHSVIIGVKFEL